MALFLTEEGFWNVMGSSGILVDSRIPDIRMILCKNSCLGKPCYSSNPGCKIEEILLQVYFKYWNNLLGLMDD